MDFLIILAMLLVATAVFLCALFYVVRTAVKEGMQMALRADLLDQRALGKADVP